MFARSFNKAFGMAEGMPVHIDPLFVSKGTDLRAEADVYGYVFAYDSPYEVIATSHMGAEEMLRIRGIARTVESYVGDGGFKKSIPRILNDTGIKPYDLFARLSAYITKKGLGNKTRKKEHLARILFAFAGDIYDDLADAVKLDILKDVIYTDLESMISEDALRKFDKKGWNVD